MLMDDVDATSVAFEVGYESQFNREYSRFFGHHRCGIFALFARQAPRSPNRSVISGSVFKTLTDIPLASYSLLA